jgi:hypothetical protein
MELPATAKAEEPMDTAELDLFAELAHRESDGLEVSLLWTKADNSLIVSVADAKSGDTFELSVGDHDPLGVFHHPYAYAALHGIAYDVVDQGRTGHISA